MGADRGASREGPSEHDDDAPVDDAQPTFRSQLEEAAGRSGFRVLKEGETPSAAALVQAVGGVRGILEAVLPGLVFLLLYTFTKNVPLALGLSVGIAVVFVVARAVTRSATSLAIGGLVGVALSAVITLATGRAENNFLLGFWLDAGYGAVLLVSMIARWPLVGVVLGYLLGDGTSWRADRRKFRVMQVITGIVGVLFAGRLVVQLPFYFSGDVEVLGTLKLLMGVPLYATMLVIAWLLVRTVYDLKKVADES